MLPVSTLSLLINGLTLALALGFLLIVLWYDVRRAVNQSFAAFLILVTVWTAGSLLGQAGELVEIGLPWTGLAFALREIGFAGSSVSIYILMSVIVGQYSRRFRLLSFLSLLVVVAYNFFLLIFNPIPVTLTSPPPLSGIFYIIFDGLTLYLIWRYRRKIRSAGIIMGTLVFLVGQGLGFLNPELGAAEISTGVSAVGALVVSFSVLQQQVITPLIERISQVESMHRVSLAITSQLATDTVLDNITTQAVKWLDADASCIFLVRDGAIELVTVHELPESYRYMGLEMGQGVAGTVASTRESIFLENYGRDWLGKPDMPLARETFGSVICVPLIYGQDVIGVLMVIASPQRRMFGKEDVHLLELLGAQAAVAIAHGRLFAEQVNLTTQLESAHSQLETVLTSTENPVIAVSRCLKVIFANPAAKKLFQQGGTIEGRSITDLIPAAALPVDYRVVLRELRQNHAYTYEVSLGNLVYMCHLASLGEDRIQGWVAVLNDVTQLKELDRLKSEMVRMTSHDLKNPLQAAMANLELLKDDVGGVQNNTEILISVDAIEKQLEKMNRLIRGILDLERVRLVKITEEYCDSVALVQRAVDDLRDLAMEKGIQVSLDVEADLPGISGDFAQFERALINILENAIKFTQSGGKVWVTARQENSNVVFRFKDTGVGIPEAVQDKIFDRFFRGRQPAVDHVSGTGLGLSLVKTVVENHKGQIWVDSHENEGTTFTISVPVAQPEILP